MTGCRAAPAPDMRISDTRTATVSTASTNEAKPEVSRACGAHNTNARHEASKQCVRKADGEQCQSGVC
eukprot:12146883-Alexandrium_andersonii.AAC.1